MSKDTYKVVGVSKLNGEMKVRFAHDMMYVKCLAKANNTDIELFEAPDGLDKAGLTAWLKTLPRYTTDQEFKETVDDRLAMYAKKEANAAKSVMPKAVKAPKTATVTKAKPTLASIKAKVAPVAAELAGA